MPVSTADASFLTAFSRALPEYLQQQRWFAGKARRIEAADVLDVVPISRASSNAYLFLVHVKFGEAESHTYAVPLVEASSGSHGQPGNGAPAAINLHVEEHGREENRTFVDAVRDERFLDVLLDAIAKGATFKGEAGELVGVPSGAFSRLRGDTGERLQPSILKAEQSNTSVAYGGRLILKMFRRIAEGTNPEVEVCSFLTEKTSFANFPAVAGTIEYRRTGSEPISIAVLESFVPNQGDAWKYTLAALEEYFDGLPAGSSAAQLPAESILALSRQDTPPAAAAQIGNYLGAAGLLGRRTAELHLAMASAADDPAFAPERFSPESQRALYDSMVKLSRQNFELLRERRESLGPEARELAQSILDREHEVFARFEEIRSRAMTGLRIRIHGDYHLGQVLFTGDDFFIIDFEGEPFRSIRERRMKYSALRDIAGMLRSFHYAASTGARECAARRPDADRLHPRSWAQYWQVHVSAAFLKAYFSAAGQAAFLPQAGEELESMLDAYLLEKAIYELGYELNSRPDWIRIPLEGIWQTLEGKRPARAENGGKILSS